MDPGHIRVLLVERAPEHLEHFQALLESVAPPAVETAVATDPDDAFARLDEGVDDVCLVGPGVDEETALALLERAARRLLSGVVVTAGTAADAWESRAEEAGAADVVHRPDLRPAVLRRSLRYAAESARRRRAEARFRAVIENAHDLVAIVGADGSLAYVSPSLRQILGHDPSEKTGTEALLEVHPADRDRVRTEFRRVRGDRSAHVRLRCRVRHRDGGWRHFDLQATNHLDDPAVRGVVVNAWDVTDLERTTHALGERVKELRLISAATRIMNRHEVPLEERLRSLLAEIPAGWQHPDLTAARVLLPELSVSDPGFPPDAPRLSTGIRVESDVVGRIEVALTGPPPGPGGPFLDEETDLLENLARIVGEAVEVGRLNRLVSQTVAALDEAVFVVDGRDGRRTIRDVNPAAERVFGYTREELVGRSTSLLYPDPRVYARFTLDAHAAFDASRVLRSTHPMRRKDGTVFEAEQTVTLLDPSRGPEGGVVTVARDVSERRRAEAELRRSEERFRQIAEKIDDVFWISTPDKGTTEYVSPAFEEIWGIPSEALYRNSMAWADAVHPEDRERVVRGLAHQIEGGYEEEYRIVRPDGEVRWIQDRAFVVRDADGEVARLVGVAEDVTGRKMAEERFALLSQEVADAIYVVGPDGRVRFSSPAVESLTGYTREEFEGTDSLEVVHPEDREEVERAFGEVVSKPGASARVEHRVLTRDGEVRHVESVGRNRRDHPGIGGVVVTTRDVTERIALEEQLRQGQRMEAIGRLAGGIAHDFNNLLTVIRSQTDLLLLDLADEGTVASDLRLIQSSADRAARLTSQLLAFSREQVLQPRVVDLGGVVGGMTELLERALGERVTIEADLPGDLPPVRIDPVQLEQVVMNLAVNARDAMPDGGTLSIRTGLDRVDQEKADALVGLVPGDWLLLEVEDTGVGMDEETLSRIFEPFFTRKETGTGLGMATAYGIVKQSGGTIHVTSRPGRGTRFSIRFPVAGGEAQSLPEVEPAGPAGPDTEAVEGRVLVVEDDPDVQRAAVKILARAGLEVEAAGTAEEGLDRLLSNGTIDVVLTDLVLPGMSGRRLVERVRRERPATRLVVMSGYAGDSPGERGDLPAEVSFIQKPFAPEDLVRTVRGLLTAD